MCEEKRHCNPKKKIKYTYISSSFWSASFQAFPRVVLFHSQTFWPCFCHMGLSISTNTWEGSRSSQVQILMSLNHLTHGYFWSFSCLVNCTVLGVFHSLKDPLWKYLMSINGPNEPIGQPSRDPSTTLWPEVTSVQPGAAFPFLSFCGAVLSCCPSWVAPGSSLAVLLTINGYQASTSSIVGLCLLVRPWDDGMRSSASSLLSVDADL